MDRRSFVRNSLAASTGLALATSIPEVAGANDASAAAFALKGNVNHSVCKWCYPDSSVEELAEAGAEMGLRSIELLGPEDWAVLKKHGLVCAMSNGPSRIDEGFNRIENHTWLVPGFVERIEEVADAGFEKVICFSGNRKGLNDEEGLENCAKGVKQIMSAAEKHDVVVCMELLNSKVDHKDYQCDRTAWGVELVKRVGSDHFKLLYDIYHMQIMEGDVIRTLRDNADYIAHYHTGGNPGRNEIDETQELNYKAIMNAIVDTGYEGFVAQEFIPTRVPLESLNEAIQICDV